MKMKIDNEKIKLKELIVEILKQEGFQISNTIKKDWIMATKGIQGLSNTAYIIQGKYPTEVMHIDKHNNEIEIYMNNGWQVNLKSNISDSVVLKNARLVGVPATNFEF